MAKSKEKLTGGKYLVSHYWRGALQVDAMRILSTQKLTFEYIRDVLWGQYGDVYPVGRGPIFRVYYVTSDSPPKNLTKKFEQLLEKGMTHG